MQHFLEQLCRMVLFWCKDCDCNKEHYLFFKELKVLSLVHIWALGLGFKSRWQIQVLTQVLGPSFELGAGIQGSWVWLSIQPLFHVYKASRSRLYDGVRLRATGLVFVFKSASLVLNQVLICIQKPKMSTFDESIKFLHW